MSALKQEEFHNSLLSHFRSLSFNQISTLPKGLLSNNGELDNLKIDNNPLVCDCRINWLVDWLKQQQQNNNDEPRNQRCVILWINVKSLNAN